MSKTKGVLVAVLSAAVLQANLLAVEIIAHRGASYDAPENALSAMKLAWVQNADAIELDLWLSKDGKIIVFHDATTKRYNGQNRKISDLTLEEARQIDVGTWKNAKFAGEKIPSLESILTTIPKGKRAVIEVKCGPEIVPELVRVLKESGRPSNELCIISFNYEMLKASKAALPSLEHYFLHSYEKNATTGAFPELTSLIERAKAARFDGLNLQFKFPIDKSFVQQVKAAGLKMFVWTVDDAAVATRLIQAGVDGITTNRPEWLRAQLNSSHAAKP